MPKSPAPLYKIPFLNIILWLLIAPFLLTSCEKPASEIHPSAENLEPSRQTLYVFGTLVNIELYADNPQQAQTAIQQIEQRFHQLHRDWHAWEKGGIIARINQAIANQTPITIPDSLKTFIQKSQQLCQSSQGYFDPGIGSLIALWGFHSDHWQGPPPSAAALQAYRQNRPSILDIQIQGNQLTSRNPQVALDFGGNAKGLALDIAQQSLQKAGIQHALINIGGDIQTLGLKPNHQPWRIGIQNPQNPKAAPIGYIELNSHESIVTSGTYQRYYRWQNQSYSHLLNPKTGYPIDHEKPHFTSVTVIHPDATTADAAATALIIAGPKHWQSVAQQMKITQALLIDSTGNRHFTPAMQKRFHPLPN